MGTITEENISDAMREIRLALLEADVNYQVVKEFISNVKEKALGLDVGKSLKPDELFIKLVKDELIELLGGEYEPLKVNNGPKTKNHKNNATTITTIANLRYFVIFFLSIELSSF